MKLLKYYIKVKAVILLMIRLLSLKKVAVMLRNTVILPEGSLCIMSNFSFKSRIL